MKIKTTNIWFLVFIILFICLVFCIGFLPQLSSNVASASSVTFNITQTQEVVYMAKNYLQNNKFANHSTVENEFENALYSAIKVTAKIGNQTETVNIPQSDFTFENITEMIVPNEYSVNLKFVYSGNEYSKQCSFVISKKQLRVKVKLNNLDSLTINEGESYTTKIEYVGFVGSDNVSTLQTPAYMVMEPKRPITDNPIVATGAESDLYDIVYDAARLTILSSPINIIKQTVDSVDYVVLKGEYSPYCQLDFTNIGISLANASYVKIQSQLEKYYQNSGIYEEYSEVEAFSINLVVDNEKEDNATSEITVKLAQKNSGKKKYLIVAFYNNGQNAVLSGTEKNGYLTFEASDLGDFVVFTPIEGISTTTLVIIIIGVVGGVVLLIFLISIFRRKY